MANLGYILKENVMTSCGEMSDKDFRDTITGLFRYAAYGEEPTFSTTLQKIVFSMEKPSIDYNNKKWEEKRKMFKGRIEDFDN